MKTKTLFLAAAVALAGCVSSNGPKDSSSHYAETALKPWVEKGELPGAISVFYKDGVQETACLGYADAAAKRPIQLDNV